MLLFFIFVGMNWDNIVGHKDLIKLLQESIRNQRVGHAQLFVGEEGYGTLPIALAFAKEILSQENGTSASKVSHLNHLDLHFSFPVYSEKNVSLSSRLFPEWREMILANPYSNFDDWTNYLDSEKKQFFISASEAEDMNKKFSLKSFEGGSKILIVWRADKMNDEASNKLLKFLEEPPQKTYIILCANSVDDILPTILSRCQLVNIPRIEETDLIESIMSKGKLDELSAKEIAFNVQGNWGDALKLLNHEYSDQEFEELFVQWVRNAFMAKKKPEVIREIIKWARNISNWNRDRQIKFLSYCSEIFRLAILQNYGNQNLVYKNLSLNNFNWNAFSKYIHGANIESILEEISEASYHISRNANAKIVWTDMGIKLTRYIHRKA